MSTYYLTWNAKSQAWPKLTACIAEVRDFGVWIGTLPCENLDGIRRGDRIFLMQLRKKRSRQAMRPTFIGSGYATSDTYTNGYWAETNPPTMIGVFHFVDVRLDVLLDDHLLDGGILGPLFWSSLEAKPLRKFFRERAQTSTPLEGGEIPSDLFRDLETEWNSFLSARNIIQRNDRVRENPNLAINSSPRYNLDLDSPPSSSITAQVIGGIIQEAFTKQPSSISLQATSRTPAGIDKAVGVEKDATIGLAAIPSPEKSKHIPASAGSPIDLSPTFREGAFRQIVLSAHERNHQARIRCIEHHGLDCVICGFNFERVYGNLGIGFIEVHHLNPISEIDGEHELDPTRDLRPVCPNCHAMLHRGDRLYAIEELKALLKVKSLGELSSR